MEAPVTQSAFLAAFPEFSDATMFPPSQFTFWAGVAAMMLNPVVWGTTLQVASFLYIAHNLALEAMAQFGVDGGGIPGLTRGVVSSEAAGSASVSYDTAVATDPDAGHWNLTVYGLRLARWIKMFGARPIYVGGGFCSTIPQSGAFRCGAGCFAGPGWGWGGYGGQG